MNSDPLAWFQIALQLQGSVVPIILPRILLCSLFALMVSLFYHMGVPISSQSVGIVITNVVFSLVLGLLLVFRTNTAYDRFWEGRKCWGTLVVTTRNLARQIRVGVSEKDPEDQAQKTAILQLLIAFAIATKLRLRQEPINDEIESLISPTRSLQLTQAKSPPLQVAVWIGDYLQTQYHRNCLNSLQLAAMNQLLDSMVEALTGCERILSTPIPLAYAIYLKRLLLIYSILLPFQVVEELHWWTGAVVFLMCFVLFGVEEIGNEIENPFGYDANDLRLDEICTTIRHNVEDLIPGGMLDATITSDNDLERAQVE